MSPTNEPRSGRDHSSDVANDPVQRLDRPQRCRKLRHDHAADEEVADELAIGPGSPVWLVESLNKDAATDAPIYLTERWIRADAIRLVFDARRPR